MSNEPFFISWAVQADSEDTLTRVTDALQLGLAHDSVFNDETITLSGGKEVVRVEEHRVAEYFDRLSILPGTSREKPSLRLFFQRKPTSGRFWKDVMAAVLRRASHLSGKVFIALDYRIDDEELYASTMQIPQWFSRLGDNSKKFWTVSAKYLLWHPSFTFRNLQEASGIPLESLKAMHRNSYKAIKHEASSDPLWMTWNYSTESNVYRMEPVVRDEILSLAPQENALALATPG